MPPVVNRGLTAEEREGIVLAAKSAFTKLKNLYQEITPIVQKYGFTVPSAGVIARDLSERIEVSIVQHCATFSKGEGHCDLARGGAQWEVKIKRDSGLTINQSKTVNGENYIVINYKAQTKVTRIFVLWESKDEFFSPRKANTNARSLRTNLAGSNIELLFSLSPSQSTLSLIGKARPAKAAVTPRSTKNTA